jgi:hypothetical protein
MHKKAPDHPIWGFLIPASKHCVLKIDFGGSRQQLVGQFSGLIRGHVNNLAFSMQLKGDTAQAIGVGADALLSGAIVHHEILSISIK